MKFKFYREVWRWAIWLHLPISVRDWAFRRFWGAA
jgi:hypothetical protein